MNSDIVVYSLIGIFIGFVIFALSGYNNDRKLPAKNSQYIRTEIESYRLKCTEIDSGICISYSMMKLNKE